MAKKHNQFDDENEVIETSTEIEGANDAPIVDQNTPDSAPVDGGATPDPDPVNNPEPVVDQNTPDPTPFNDETLSQDPVPTDSPSTDEDKGTSEVIEGTTDTPDPDPKPVDSSADEPRNVPVNEFKRFDVRFGYSTDSRATTGRRTMSVAEIVKQFVAAPTCFIAFETKEDLDEFKAILAIKSFKVPNNEGKLVEFTEGKKHLIDRISEHSTYWIEKHSK
jgi:hypothetical protein